MSTQTLAQRLDKAVKREAETAAKAESQATEARFKLLVEIAGRLQKEFPQAGSSYCLKGAESIFDTAFSRFVVASAMMVAEQHGRTIAADQPIKIDGQSRRNAIGNKVFLALLNEDADKFLDSAKAIEKKWLRDGKEGLMRDTFERSYENPHSVRVLDNLPL